MASRQLRLNINAFLGSYLNAKWEYAFEASRAGEEFFHTVTWTHLRVES
jgi:hypothetical protein